MRQDGTVTGIAGAIVYWHVDEVTATYNKLMSMGAKDYEAATEEAGNHHRFCR